MADEVKLSEDMEAAIDRRVEAVLKKMKKKRSRSMKFKALLSLLILSVLGGSAVAIKRSFEDDKKSKDEVHKSTEVMRAKAESELDKITGSNKVLHLFGDWGGRAAQFLREKQASDK